MSALAGRQVFEAPHLLWNEELGEETIEGRRKSVRRLLRLGIMLLIILLLIGFAWVVPVASQFARALAQAASSFVAIQAIV
ncbi:MAG: hypothetical protein PVG25_06295 [Anaerolineae bacterium]